MLGLGIGILIGVDLTVCAVALIEVRKETKFENSMAKTNLRN